MVLGSLVDQGGVMQPLAWLADDIKRATEWIRPLSASEKTCLRDGLGRFLKLEIPIEQATGADFDFGDLSPLLKDLRQQLYRGFGLVLVKGFPIGGLSEQEIKALYWGFTNQLGVLRPQGKNSALMNHVKNTGGVYRQAGGRGYNTNSELDFHVDFADWVGLLCIQDAKAGGMSKACSSRALFDALAEAHPELAKALMEPICYSRQDEQSADERPFYKAPIVAIEQGWFSCRYTRNHIRYAHRHEGASAPTPMQEQAMNWLDTAAKDNKFAFEMRLEPGDLQIINNHVVLHSRTAYEDHEEPEKKRSLLRAWIATPDSQPLSLAMAEAYHDHRPGSVRGGIVGQAFDQNTRNYTRAAAKFHNMVVD